MTHNPTPAAGIYFYSLWSQVAGLQACPQLLARPSYLSPDLAAPTGGTESGVAQKERRGFSDRIDHSDQAQGSAREAH